LRQLQWWEERGLVRVAQFKHSRIWQGPDILRVLMIRELQSKGLHLREIRHLFQKLRHSQLVDGYLLTNGADVRLAASDLEAIKLARTFKGGLYVVSIADQLEHLRRCK
jgi:DNA-binding transcriptional MerR regulator